MVSLPESLDNIVDNLSTKMDLTYDEVTERLLDVTSKSINIKENDIAFKAYTPNKN